MKNFKLYLIFIFFLCQYQPGFSYNPIDENTEYWPEKLINFNIIDQKSGPHNDPGSLYFSFSVINKDNNRIFFYSKTNFSVMIGNKKVKNFLFQTSYDDYKIFIPRLPCQVKNGYYDLKLKIVTHGTAYLNYNKKNSAAYISGKGGNVNLILIIDTSASMFLNDKGNFRKTAIKNIRNYLKTSGPNSKISIIKFSSYAKILCPLTSVYNSSLLDNAVNQIDANGETNIGDALNLALQEIIKEMKKERTITIFLTDGQNTAPYKNNHLKFKELNSPIYTIGLTGSVNNILLSEIAESTGGEYYKIPDSFKIQDIYFKIVNKEINKKIFLSEDIFLRPHQATNINFYPDKSIKKLNILSYWDNGSISITTRPEIKQYDLSRFNSFQLFNLKDLNKKKYAFNIKNSSDQPNKISLFAFIDSNLVMRSYLSKTYNYLNEPVELSVLLFQDDQPILNSSVYAYIYSKKTNCILRLYDDGLHNDDDKNDGLYKNYFFNERPGDYKVVFKVTGKNLYSENFNRQEHKCFFTDSEENNNLKIMPSNISFNKIGADEDYYKGLELFSLYSNHLSTRIIPVNLSFSNEIIKNIEEKIKIKPAFFIVEPLKNKLFNVSINFPKNEKNGSYSGNLILMVNKDFFNIPFHVNFYKYNLTTDRKPKGHFSDFE